MNYINLLYIIFANFGIIFSVCYCSRMVKKHCRCNYTSRNRSIQIDIDSFEQRTGLRYFSNHQRTRSYDANDLESNKQYNNSLQLTEHELQFIKTYPVQPTSV